MLEAGGGAGVEGGEDVGESRRSSTSPSSSSSEGAGESWQSSSSLSLSSTSIGDLWNIGSEVSGQVRVMKSRLRRSVMESHIWSTEESTAAPTISPRKSEHILGASPVTLKDALVLFLLAD